VSTKEYPSRFAGMKPAESVAQILVKTRSLLQKRETEKSKGGKKNGLMTRDKVTWGSFVYKSGKKRTIRREGGKRGAFAWEGKFQLVSETGGERS